MTGFMQEEQAFFTSESVTEGHLDKLCDQISDEVSDAILLRDPDALTGAKLWGASLKGTQADQSSPGKSAKPVDLSSHALVAMMTDLRGSDLSGLCLTAIDLARKNLSAANLSGCDLRGADLSGCNLSGANLSGANLLDANLDGSNLSNANVEGACLAGASLVRARMDGANLIRAHPSGCPRWPPGLLWLPGTGRLPAWSSAAQVSHTR